MKLSNEIKDITREAIDILFQRGVMVRNQAVLQRGVNDDLETWRLFVRRLGQIHVQPYYVYVHDLVRGVEDLRTTVATAIELEKGIRGATAGFNSPTFVVDAPGGGGKRDVHSFEYYDPETGVSVYRSPNVDPDKRVPYVQESMWARANKAMDVLTGATTMPRHGAPLAASHPGAG